MNPIFEKGGKFYWLHSTVDAFETFLHVPGTVTRKGSHARDAIDLKRILILVVIAAVPAALFGMWNVGYQHGLATGDTSLNILGNWWYGFLRVLPLYLVSYIVGLGIEFASCQIRGEEVSEGYLVSGFFIPLIVPVDIPLWMLAVAVAFAVIFGKEVFGGTGMNIWNPALVARAFLFFAYPSKMSGDSVWYGEGTPVDGFTGATPLSLASNGFQTNFCDAFYGFIPGSIGETSALAILIGGVFLLLTGVASWKTMCSVFVGGALTALLFNTFGSEANNMAQLPWYLHLVYGGFCFGAVFMATDPVTSARTETGKYIFGFLVGAMAIIIRVLNPGCPEGMMLAILFMNTVAPLIDYLVVDANISRRKKRAKSTK